MPPSYPNILDKAMHGSLEAASSTDQEFFLCHSDPRFEAEDLVSCYLYTYGDIPIPRLTLWCLQCHSNEQICPH